MNKAFTKEDDGSTPERLPDLPISGHPNHVTPQGLAALKARHASLEAEVNRLREGREFLDDLHPLAVAERDLRYVEARLNTAILVPPPEGPCDQVLFGATVTVADEEGRQASYTIVGEDESDPEKRLISAFSPLARALIEARVGDIVEWPKPTGVVELEVRRVTYRA
ncbi:Transcription elongation factor, GreA/GreB family [Roseovarius marisflavi]|uniref:Transcription elongation factor, GreA/GreB family n=1 Tax=Roseovarius marisflavi TaxID=1054996 RepID=A0A1M7A3L5_9RHOB|nr:GreA/GreB family elongation factor [Roseovarius marisflavi]SHL37260.1 Transcription elongation factor, GreA/GreB family [Roseovarius marisflavi]